MAEENATLIKNDPSLVKMIISAQESDATSGTTSLSSLEDINLTTMSASDILNYIDKYKASESTTTSSSGSDIVA